MAVNKEEMSSKWWTQETVAVVTGANRVLGFEIVWQLAENGLTVVLTARDADRGKMAMKTLHDQGLNNVVFHQLDIGNPKSVSDFARWVKDNYGGLDILVNNAGVSGISIDSEAAIHALQDPDLFNKPQLAEAFETNYEMSKNCIEINYYGTKRVTEALLPLLRSEGRIMNVSSEPGLLKFLENDSLRQQLSNVSEITEELLDKMLETFLDDMKMDRLEGKGWPKFSPQFALSEMALNAYARLLAQKLSNCEEGKRLYVNSVNPGSIQTTMSDYTGDLTASEGAETIEMVALLPPGGPSGQFFFMKEPHSF